MSLARAETLARPARIGMPRGGVLIRGTVTAYLSLVVLLPLAGVLWRSTTAGRTTFWQSITAADSLAALKLSFFASLLVVAINAVTGTLLAWVLVRDSFGGKSLVDAVVDLPFALPTIVAGLTLLTLYGPQSPFHINAAYSQAGVLLALLFVTLPFVVRAVQPVLLELDLEMEEAAASLGAGQLAIFRRIILPNLLPAILSGIGLGFARSMGEFGAVVLISGNIPFQTEVASVHIYGQIQSENLAGAAAISIVLLATSLAVLLAISGIERWGRKHDG